MSFQLESEGLLKEFEKLSQEPLQTAKAQAEGTNGVIAVAGMYMPEELIHAAGFLPIVLLEQNGPVSSANSHVQSFMCGYVRSLMDQVLDEKLKFLKALFIKDCCHEIRMIGDLARCTQKDKCNIEFFFFPVTIKKEASQKYIAYENGNVKAVVEKLAGKTISDAAIAESIKVYNKFRKAMIALYDLRRDNPGVISEMDLRNVVRAAMSMKKEVVTDMVEKLTVALKNDIVSGALKTKKGPKVIVSGSLCECLEPAVIRSIENAGAIIADDDVYVGSRYFNTLVDEAVSPMEALTKAYIFRNGPCATQLDDDNRNSDWLKAMAEKAGAKGIITVVIKFCEAHYFGNLADVTDLEKSFNGKVFTLFTDHESEAEGQIATRVQSFIENL